MKLWNINYKYLSKTTDVLVPLCAVPVIHELHEYERKDLLACEFRLMSRFSYDDQGVI
jgi:hypothetical protein